MGRGAWLQRTNLWRERTNLGTGSERLRGVGPPVVVAPPPTDAQVFWVFMALRPAQAGPECVGDVGRCHGYMPAGYIGAHPSNRGVHSCTCTWSAESRCVAWRASGGQVNSRANGHAGGCDSTCQAKCQATWQAGGFPNVRACYARWAKLNTRGDASGCEYRVGYRRSAPGCE
jgi:hypothetical protein